MSIPEPAVLGTILSTAVKAKSDLRPRTLQGHAGIIGPSDLGFCRNKAALMTRGVPQSDSKSTWPADVGTAIHEWVEDAVKSAFPDWLVEQRVTAEFPCGATISGSCDLIIPTWNLVLDIKTVDGFEKIRRYGTSQNHKYQRHTYALGALREGILDETRPVYVGNAYFDRSGQESEPYIVVEEFDPLLTDEINAWIEDVIYAVQHDEQASQDVTATVCERICEFYTACRGGTLPEREPAFITDDETRKSIRLYVDGSEMEKAGKKMKEQARADLVGVAGSDGEYQIRWTRIDGTEIPGFFRDGYDRLDVRKVRR